jgi:hypothetical protein
MVVKEDHGNRALFKISLYSDSQQGSRQQSTAQRLKSEQVHGLIVDSQKESPQQSIAKSKYIQRQLTGKTHW